MESLPEMGTISACEQGERMAMEQDDAAQWEHREMEQDDAAINLSARGDRMIPDPRFFDSQPASAEAKATSSIHPVTRAIQPV